MAKIQIDLDKEEDRIVRIVKEYFNLKDKKLAIKKIIKEYGRKIKIQI